MRSRSTECYQYNVIKLTVDRDNLHANLWTLWIYPFRGVLIFCGSTSNSLIEVIIWIGSQLKSPGVPGVHHLLIRLLLKPTELCFPRAGITCRRCSRLCPKLLKVILWTSDFVAILLACPLLHKSFRIVKAPRVSFNCSIHFVSCVAIMAFNI